MDEEFLSLSEALNTDRLEEFIQQQKAAGVGSIREADFDQLSETLIKSEQSADQTSRFASRDGSTGKRTR